jgi:hypothetical protein
LVTNRYSLSGVMRLVGVLAIDMALLPIIASFAFIPFLLFVLIALNVVLVQAFVVGRPLRARDYIFLGAGTAYFILISMMPPLTLTSGMVRIVNLTIEWFSVVTDSEWLWRFVHSSWLELSTRLVASVVGLLVAWLAGRLVERQLQRRERQSGEGVPTSVVPVFQGAVIGLGLAAVGIMMLAFFPGSHTAFWYALRVALVAPILGGLAGWFVSQARGRRPGCV